jgi:TonB family protein
MSQPDPKSPQKKTAPTPDRASQELPQRSALQPSQGSSQDSLKTASERQLLKKDAASDSGAGSTAATSSAAVHSDPISIDPAKATGGALVGTVTQGEVLNQVLHEVSAKSRSTIHGTVRVIVKVHVDASGTVTGAEPAASPSKFFGDAAVQAAKHWDFAPAKVADQRVPSEWLVRFDFTQTDTKVLPSQTKP